MTIDQAGSDLLLTGLTPLPLGVEVEPAGELEVVPGCQPTVARQTLCITGGTGQLADDNHITLTTEGTTRAPSARDRPYAESLEFDARRTWRGAVKVRAAGSATV